MSQHTPGPWTIEEYGDDDTPALVIHRDTETRVCFMATPGSRGDPAKIEADARLIAAAPELLAVMIAACDHSDRIIAEHGEPRTPVGQKLYDAARAVIAKATLSSTDGMKP